MYKLLHDSILLGSNVESGWWLDKLGAVNLLFVIQLEEVRILASCPERFVDPANFFVVRLLISCSRVWNTCHLVSIARFSNLGHLRRLDHWYLLGLCFGLHILFCSSAFSADFLAFLGWQLPPDCCAVLCLEAWLVPSPWFSLVTILEQLISCCFSSLPFRTLKSRKSPRILLASFFQISKVPLISFHSLLSILLSSF